MKDETIPFDYYENILLHNNVYNDEILKALNVVKHFIIDNKKLLVGGMAIDYALKLYDRNAGIYDEKNTVPDYDFFSEQHFVDAYDLAAILYKKGFKKISVINAMHPSTMKVRVNFITVADITFIHKKILNKLPFLRYKSFKIIHPHFQMIDQHRSLTLPYENPPWETIMFRPKKDMTRYDKLYDFYPIKSTSKAKLVFETKEVSLKVLSENCLSGFFALNYWIQYAAKLGYQSTYLKGAEVWKRSGGIIKADIPAGSKIVIYSDNLKKLIKAIGSKSDKKYYNKFLDKFPRKVVFDDFILFENNQKITAASAQDGMFIANLQNIMLYFLTNYSMFDYFGEAKADQDKYIKGYKECRSIIAWAGKKYYSEKVKNAKLEKLFPTYEVYGECNISESYIVAKFIFDAKNSPKPRGQVENYTQPRKLYETDLMRKTSKKYDFDPAKSRVFDFDGSETKNFIK